MARYTHIIDAKGRVTVPARVRSTLDGVLYVTHSLDEGYLSAYTAEQFRAIRDQLAELPGTDPAVRRLRREIIGEAMSCEMDSQGRISVSEELWSHIDVQSGDEICFLDLFEKLEICSKAFYEEQKAKEIPLRELDLSEYSVKGI